MRKISILISLLVISFAANAQNSVSRDSLANTSEFQTKTRSASLIIANQKLSDTSVKWYVTNFAQIIVTEPKGAWITPMSYGVIVNPAMNSNSTDADFEYTVGQMFERYARAFYKVLHENQTR